LEEKVNGEEQLAFGREVVEELCRQSEAGDGFSLRRSRRAALPSRDRVIEMVEQVRIALFPGYFGDSEMGETSIPYYVGSTLDRVRRDLAEQVRRGFCFTCQQEEPRDCSQCESKVAETTRAWLARLPHVQRLLFKDVVAAYQGDPAATSPDEAVLCYPGILAITNYRIAHELHRLGVPLVPRMITEYAHSLTGIDIHPGAAIDEAFFIDHGTGVVVGETCEIGKRVRIYQGVTLGARSFPLDENGNPVKGIPRHPMVEDDVIIYSGATILGRVRIGRASVIGGNVWLIHSVPPGSQITQAGAGEDGWERPGGGGKVRGR
jgi:serine O-acetyltransferase